jgi:hypothetical protein
MTSILKVDTIQDTAGNNIINESSDTITIGASGDTVNIVGTLQNNGSGLVSGITEADQWRLTADITANVDPIASNLERVDNTGFGYIGTGMSVASGTWTFPSTGIYLIRVIATLATQSGDNSQIQIKVTTDNLNYTQVAMADEGESNSLASSASCEFLFDVTDTANCKARFEVTSLNPGSVIEGDTNKNRTSFTFIRLGDT